jgi:hypothetical protein
VGADRGSIVLSWLTKLTIGLAIAGALFFDTFSLMATNLGAQDQASGAAYTAAQTWRETKDLQATFNAAAATIEPGTGAEIDPATFRLDANGTAVVTVHRTAPSFLLKHIPPLRRFADASATAESLAPSY